MDSNKVICFDIGGTFVKYGVLDYEGNILSKDSFKSNTDNGQEILDNMCEVIKKYINLYKNQAKINKIIMTNNGITKILLFFKKFLIEAL